MMKSAACAEGALEECDDVVAAVSNKRVRMKSFYHNNTTNGHHDKIGKQPSALTTTTKRATRRSEVKRHLALITTTQIAFVTYSNPHSLQHHPKQIADARNSGCSGGAPLRRTCDARQTDSIWTLFSYFSP